MDIRIELKDQVVLGALNRLLAAGADLSPGTKAVAAHLLSITETAFENEQDPVSGEPWAALADVTVEERKALGYTKGGIPKKLQRTRNLLSSILSDYDRSSAVVGTNLVYATTQHFGAKRGQFGTGSFETRSGSFPIPWGDIPARPFLGVSAKDEDTIIDKFNDYLRQEWLKTT